MTTEVVKGRRGNQVFTLQGGDSPYRVLVEGVSEGALVLTPEGMILYANRRLGEMLRTPLDQVIGARFDCYITPADRPLFAALLQPGNVTPSRHIEVSLVAADTTAVPCLLSVNSLRIAEVQGAFCVIATDLSEQKRGEAMVAAERLARSILDQVADAIVVCDNDTCIVRASQAAHTLCGKNPLGRPFAQVFPVQRVDGGCLPLVEELLSGVRHQVEARLARQGSVFSLLISAGPLIGPQGERLGTVISLTDMTARRRAEEALRESEQRMTSIVEFLPVGVWFLDARGEIVFANAAGRRIWAAEARMGIHEFGFFKGWWADTKRPLGPHDWGGARAIEHGETSLDEEIEIECFDGSHRIILSSAVPIRGGNGAILGAVVLNQDITEHKATAEQIEQLAYYDPLTQLPNRRLLLDRLRQIMVGCARTGQQGALLFIDLDEFKVLNDSLGHDIGDLLLKQVALRLRACVRAGDTVARLGGDEFVLVLKDLSEQAAEAAVNAQLVGGKVLAALQEPYELAGRLCHSTPSLGVTLIDGHATTVDDLLRQADLAMYRAKAAGRNTLCFYDPEMQSAVKARAALEAQLREGLRVGLCEGQFLLYYQPQVDERGILTGAEALLRWRHPQRGLIPPVEFIPLAEETGLILPLGHWVLEMACSELAAWARRPETAGLTLAVNVSARQFRHSGFVDQVRELLARHCTNPRRIKLELTESLLLDDLTDTIAKMTSLKALGLGLSLDDFGTGYSSLVYLKRLPLDQLKIDQSFVQDVLSDTNGAAIARTIVALAHSLGLAVIAEGVETPDQRAFLIESGCRAFQGYLFGRPGPAEALWECRPDPQGRG
jgi:diguanylate cyclase (GGDEF)-like protein/PAS domain S-box-containing protein